MREALVLMTTLRWLLLAVLWGGVGLQAQTTVDPSLFPTADNPIYQKIAALEAAITSMRGLIQQALTVAPKNTARRVIDPLRAAVTLANTTEEQWWRWGRPKSVVTPSDPITYYVATTGSDA